MRMGGQAAKGYLQNDLGLPPIKLWRTLGTCFGGICRAVVDEAQSPRPNVQSRWQNRCGHSPAYKVRAARCLLSVRLTFAGLFFCTAILSAAGEAQFIFNR